MRLVRWSPQERVDVPDITALSYLVLGEFRRTSRGILLGDATAVIRGFKVEPAAVPDTTIVVKLDPGGGNPLGFVLGAELVGARVDYGQLIGGDNSDDQLEGNAQEIFDFTGQPNGTYTVQMRFLTDDGENDNRAFWNESTDTEFIAAVDTRTLPTFELRISGAPSGEWVDLATVAWTSPGPIVAGNITDIRDFAVEGPAPFSVLTQDAVGAYADFNRSTDRATNGLNLVYPAMKALARQIMDIKGQDNAGNFNWFNRVFSPTEGSGAELPTEQTKSLRAVDTISFTIGDGVTEWGDYNGVSGLEDCLADIAANSALYPTKIVILLKSRDNNYDGFSWEISTAHTIDDTHIEIIGQLGGGGSGSRARINILTAAGTVALKMRPFTSDGASLTLRNISSQTGAGVVGGHFAVDASGGFWTNSFLVIDNCLISGDTSVGTTDFALDGPANDLLIQRSRILGRTRFFGDNGSDVHAGGLIRDCVFTDATIELHHATANSHTQRFDIRNCYIAGRSAAPYTSAAGGVIDARGVDGLVMDNCTLLWHGDQDGLQGGLSTFNAYISKNWLIQNCQFLNSTTGTHGVGAGNNGAEGTGWAIKLKGTNASVNTYIRNITIDGCKFGPYTLKDAGGIRVDNGVHVRIRNSTIEGLGTAAASVAYGIYLNATSAGFDAGTVIEGNFIGNWTLGGSLVFTCIKTVNVDHVIIAKNEFNCKDTTGVTAVTLTSVSAVAIILDEALYCSLEGNTFTSWADNLVGAFHTVSGLNTIRHLTLHGNNFINSGGSYAVDMSAATGGVNTGVFNDNRVRNTGVNGQGFNLSGADETVANNNAFNFSTPTQEALRFGTCVDCVAMGNRGTNSSIQKTAGTLRGYADLDTNGDTYDLNLVDGGYV